MKKTETKSLIKLRTKIREITNEQQMHLYLLRYEKKKAQQNNDGNKSIFQLLDILISLDIDIPIAIQNDIRHNFKITLRWKYPLLRPLLFNFIHRTHHRYPLIDKQGALVYRRFISN